MPIRDAGNGLFIETGCGCLSAGLDAAECKGPGHPDRLADDLAEALSRTYASRTLELCGAPLHHNFDKLALLGGEAEVRYGSGRLLKPIRVLVNGRLATHFGDTPLPWRRWFEQTIAAFFASRLPGLDCTADLQTTFNVTTASSPGHVVSSTSPGERQRWFAPRDLGDLRERRALLSNDTSFGTGYAPLSTVQRVALELSGFLGRSSADLAWLGTDTKVMTAGHGAQLDAVICAPLIARHTPSRAHYAQHLSALEQAIRSFVGRAFPSLTFSLMLNNRDRLDEDELYLTVTGSSLEAGDEGLVGRGNRLNGLITPFSPMNLEAVHGKNPVYHCGKLYNLLAHRIAYSLHESIGGQVQVNLVSATGAPLERPWRIQVRTEAEPALEVIEQIVRAQLSRLCEITAEFLAGSALPTR